MNNEYLELSEDDLISINGGGKIPYIPIIKEVVDFTSSFIKTFKETNKKLNS